MKSKKYSERLFLAVELPRFAREAIVEKRKTWRKQLEDDVKWIPPLNLRLVLRYLGEIEVSKSKQLCKKLETLAGGTKSFQLSVDSVGCSPSYTEATSLWLGFEQPEELIALLKEIGTICGQLKLPADKKPFEPRIPLSRTSDPQHIPVLSTKPEFKGFMVKSLALVESRMGPNGPSYHPLRKFTLA